MLLTKNSVDSYSLMNMPYIYNPKLYESLYIDRNVNAYIDSGAIIDEDPDDEAAVNEAIEEIPMHRKDIKVSVDCKTPSFNDLKLVKDIYNEKNFLKWYKFFRTPNRNICRDIKVEVYPNLATMAEYHQRDALKNNEVLKDSYSFDNTIVVVARSGYQPLEKKNGDYKQYLLNELIAFVCMKASSKCDRFLANCIGTALSGQVSDRLDDEIQGDYLSTNNYAILTSYMIKRLYKEKGEKEVAKLCKTGDYSVLSLYATRRLIKNIKAFGEATLTAADRKSLSDSDYGLPSKKKYPMPDESHVRSAIRFFNHVDSEDEAELARNIKKKIKKFGMSVEVGEKNRFSKYYKESALLEEFDDESKNESTINESILFSGKDLTFNINKWKPGGKNILFVVGLSGGGKSTTARAISSDFAAVYVELDRFANVDKNFKPRNNRPDEQLIYEFIKKEHIEGRSVMDMPDDEYDKYLLKFIDYIKEVASKNKNELYAIEGIQVIKYAKYNDWLYSYPIIIKGTSMIKSIMNRFRREKDFDNYKMYDNNVKDNRGIFKLLSWYIDQEESLKYLRKFAKKYNESAGVSYRPDSLYNDIMQIVDKLSGEERNRIALNGNYEDSPNVINRKIKRDENGNPIGFIDAYKFDSRPYEAQLVVALDPDHRGKGYMRNMVGDYINHPIDGYRDINRFVWFVDPMNTPSVNLATHCGFKKTDTRRYRDDLGIYEDMYEYHMPFRESTDKIPLPTKMIKESVHENGYIVTDDYMMSEDFITFFNGMDNQIISEAEKKYDNRLKKYLFKERLKNNKSVIMRYQEMKAMCPWIKYTFVKLGAYRRRNVFIDLSYYHDIFMRNMGFKKDAAVKMYWDFLNRLLNESEYKTWYKKITIFMPIWPEAWDVKSADELMDYRQSINPISMIIRMLRKNPSELKKWGNKDFLFMSPSGYFRVNFSTFDLKNLAKFKRFITKLVNNDPIDDDETEDGYRPTENQDADSTAVITANIIDKLETNAGIKIDDMTGGVGNDFIPDDAEVIKPQLTFNHLRVRAEKIKLPSKYVERENKLKDKPKNSVLILAPDGDKAAEVFNQNQFDVSMFDKRGFYAP